MNYYNENDPKAAAWLRELIKGGHIAGGTVDERSILDVRPGDLAGYVQCHFFAGIGGWSYALRLAGWPDDQPAWTGSCPCQPFSIAGRGMGEADERHLWPVFRNLIGHCRPPIVFGEQVASPDGREWLAGVRADLEDLGYQVGASDLCAASVGAPHIRQRLYWVANAGASGRGALQWAGTANGRSSIQSNGHRDTGRLANSSSSSGATPHGIGDSHLQGPQGRNERIIECAHQWPLGTPNLVVLCTDGKARRFEPGSFPLAYGVPGRVGLLQGYGNAIVPQLAAEFIQASVEALNL